MKTETTYTRRIVGVLGEGSDDSAMTVIAEYSFTEDADGIMKVYGMSVCGAYPNMIRCLYHANPLALSKQIEKQIRNIEGQKMIFNQITITIL